MNPDPIKPLDLRYLTVAASLNRAQIVALPGIAVDKGMLGKSAYELAGSEAVFERIRACGQQLRLDQTLLLDRSVQTFIAFDQCLISPDPQVCQTARKIAREFGRALGYLLVMLRRGDQPNRESRPDWDDSYWEHWRTLPSLVLGGGLIRGHLRDHLLEDIQAIFAETHTPVLMLALDTHREYLPLVGALRCAPPGYERVLALDFGGTQVKRAAGQCRAGTLTTLRTLPSLFPPASAALSNVVLEEFLEWMIRVITTSWHETQPDCPVIPVSLASYIDPEGKPLDRQGSPYALLNVVCANLQDTLSQALALAVGCEVQVRLIHDGTASATVHPGSAVITLGTALGVGYAPAVDHPLPLASPLTITG